MFVIATIFPSFLKYDKMKGKGGKKVNGPGYFGWTLTVTGLK